MGNINIGGRLHSTATGNVVTGANEILDDTNYVGGKKQSVVNSETNARVATLETAVGTGGSVDERIAAETQRAQGVEDAKADKATTYTKTEVDTLIEDAAFLDDGDSSSVIADFDPQADTLWKKQQTLSSAEKAQVQQNIGVTERLNAQDDKIEMLNGSEVIVGALPASGTLNKIYRVPDDPTSGKYTDYGWDGTQFVALCTYPNDVDEEPTAESDNLVKSGGVFSALAKAIKSSDKLFMGSTPPSPYNDLNTVPVNSVITYVSSQNIGIQHRPTKFAHFTVETKSYTNAIGGGLVQIAYSIGNIKGVAVRYNWSGNFYDWYYLAIDTGLDTKAIKSYDKIVSSAEGAVSPYDDFDTLPTNSVITYVINSQMSISHAPKFNNLTVMTFNYTNSAVGGVVQVAYRIDGTFGVAYRARWGGQAAFTEWKYFADADSYATKNIALTSSGAIITSSSSITPPYDDMDTLPVNSVVTYVITSGMQISNVPPFNQFTVMTFNYNASGVGGTIQIAYRIDGTFGVAYRARYGEQNAYNNWKEFASPENCEIKPFTSLSSFLRIGVIGDSYASGWLNVTGYAKDWRNISWIQQLARTNGVDGFNFSAGGLTSRSWLTAERGLSLLNSTDPCDLYYVVLGINDVGTLGLAYLGAISDCPANVSDTHPDTFYGNMGEIILHIKDKAPHAKIIVSTMSFNSGDYASFNDAIVTIAEHYSVPYIVQNDDSFFTSDFYNNYKVGGHPTVQLYGGMAKAIERLTNKCMIEQPSYFNDIYPSSMP